ncbi:hypothetical protein CsSME_00019105 [Camellia sinensis var. sinensis]
MLSSPGHSPLHLSSPSPSPSLSENPNNLSSSSAKNPKNQPIVLDEDTYAASIEKIIERDFFPDIPKLRDRLDWLEAVRSGDPVQIRDAQLKILERRGGRVSSNPDDTIQGKSLTPGSTFFRTSTPFELDKTPSVVNNEFSGGGESNDGSVDVSLTLDEFFRRHTSEDNDSFSKIMEKVNRKRKERYGFLIEGEKEDVGLIEDAKRERITDGYGTSDQPPSTLEGWNYTAKNLLMYNPSDRGEAPLTVAERAERLNGLTKEISRSNTRFHGKMMDSRPKEEDTVAVLYTPVPGATPVPFFFSDREADKLKSFVKTPSPAPGVDESPFITGDGPHFKIPLPPSRDVKAHSLSRDAARKLRERSKMFQKPPLPSPVRGASASPSSRTLSHAAQKFVRNAIAKSSHSVDESLRTPKTVRSLSRFGRDGSSDSRSPSVSEGSNPPW